MKLEMIFGSTSDKGKVMPGIEEFSKAHPEVEVYVHWASADNTPEKVADIMGALVGVDKAVDERDFGPHAFISGAGKSNVLTGVVKQYATLTDIVIGIPITDSITAGWSSASSTSEKPPMNPVLTVPLNGTYAAANIAYRFLDTPPADIVIFDHPDMSSTAELAKVMEKYGIEYRLNRDCKDVSDEVVITPFASCTPQFTMDTIWSIDNRLTRGSGIQVAFMGGKEMCKDHYLGVFQYDTKSTCFTTQGDYLNAVIAAAQLTQNHDALSRIQEDRDKKADALKKEPMTMVLAGHVTERNY